MAHGLDLGGEGRPAAHRSGRIAAVGQVGLRQGQVQQGQGAKAQAHGRGQGANHLQSATPALAPGAVVGGDRCGQGQARIQHHRPVGLHPVVQGVQQQIAGEGRGRSPDQAQVRPARRRTQAQGAQGEDGDQRIEQQGLAQNQFQLIAR